MYQSIMNPSYRLTPGTSLEGEGKWQSIQSEETIERLHLNVEIYFLWYHHSNISKKKQALRYTVEPYS